MLYSDEDITIVGIIPEEDLSGSTNSQELRKVIYDSLSIGPLYAPLMEDLQKKGLVQSTGDIKCKDVLKALYSNSFLNQCPKFVSHRETILNVKLITTTMLVLRRNYLTHDVIRHGLSAYVLACRDSKQDYLHTDEDKVHKALRIVNMSISDEILKKWLDYVQTNLEWNKAERRFFEREFNDPRKKEDKENSPLLLNVPFILPHEFIFLMCNSLNRIENIERLHKADFTSSLYKVNMQEVNHARSLHLLRPDSFKNKAPHKLVQQSLNIEASSKRITFIGMKPQQIKTLAQLEKEESMKDKKVEQEKTEAEMNYETINIVQNCQKLLKQYKAEKKQGMHDGEDDHHHHPRMEEKYSQRVASATSRNGEGLSRLNLKRAEQVRQANSVRRQVMLNRIKDTKQLPPPRPQRPNSSYQVAKAPARNIKNIVSQQDLMMFQNEGGILKHKLAGMTVLNEDSKQTAINWIEDELNKFSNYQNFTKRNSSILFKKHPNNIFQLTSSEQAIKAPQGGYSHREMASTAQSNALLPSRGNLYSGTSSHNRLGCISRQTITQSTDIRTGSNTVSRTNFVQKKQRPISGQVALREKSRLKRLNKSAVTRNQDGVHLSQSGQSFV